MARKVKQNSDVVKEMHKILLQNSFELVNKERFVEFFSCLTDEVKAYLLGVPMYEPIIGERVIVNVNSKPTEGIVVGVNQANLYAVVEYDTQIRRYFKTTDDMINFMNTGDYDYYDSSSSKSDVYPYMGIRTKKTSGEFAWTDIEPNHYYD